MATDWQQLIRQGGLTVKGATATTSQAQMMALICVRGSLKGANVEDVAGAIATAIQESKLTNILERNQYGCAGIFQQTDRYYGGYANTVNPQTAADAFFTRYLPYRRQGLSWLDASDKVQGSGVKTGPARWWEEALRAARFFAGTGQAQVTTKTGAGSVALADSQQAEITVTREKPYMFTRGSADSREDSWEASGRLASEVGGWRRFTGRHSDLWFVSDKWLAAHKPRYRLSETSRGVLSLSFEFEGRLKAAEASLRVIAGMYDLAPGDVVALSGQGPADGDWLVSGATASHTSPVVEVRLIRPDPKLPEPAPETEELTATIDAGGTMNVTGSATEPAAVSTLTSVAGVPDTVARAYQAADYYTSLKLPYAHNGEGRHGLVAHPGPKGDCIAAGSLVELARGAVPIEDVRAGDWALTRRGYRRVVDAWLVREDAEQVVVPLDNRRELVGTPDHRVWTANRGWVKLETLRPSDRLCGWGSLELQTGCAMRGGGGVGIQTPRSATSARITATVLSDTCTDGCGARRTARFQPVTRSITSTATRRTTRSRTLSRCPAPSIEGSPPMPVLSVSTFAAGAESCSPRRRGYVARTVSVLQPALRSSAAPFLSNVDAPGAGRCSLPPGTAARGIAPTSAGRHSTGLTGRASGAAHRSRPNGHMWQTARAGSARSHVVRPLACATRTGRGPVYDLTVEGEHEFFANGVLVHNCSSGVSWVLWQAGIRLPGGVTSGWAPATMAFPGWGVSGPGKYMTVYVRYTGDNAHIWIRWNGVGKAWRFDTGGGLAPHQQYDSRSTAGFAVVHPEGC